MNKADVPELTDHQQLAVLRAVFDSSPDLVYAVDAELRVIMCNTTFRQLSQNEQPEGMHLGELGFSAAALSEHQIAFAAYGEHVHSWCQNIEINLNGYHYANCTVIPVGNCPSIIAFHLKDYLAQPTRLKRSDALLAGDRFKRVSQSSPDSIAAVDKDLRYTTFSAAYQEQVRRQYGHDIKLGDSVAEVTKKHSHHQTLLLECFQRALDNEVVHYTMDVEGADDHRFLSMRFYPLCDSDGRINGAGQITLDVTDQISAEAALRDSELRFRTLADNISPLVWMADAKGRVVWFNQRWREFTGATPVEMKTLGWRRVVHPDHIRRVLERLQRSWDTGEVWDDVFPMKSRNGNYHWFLSRALPIRDSTGRVEHWFGTHTDITEQRAAEEALRQADHNKDRFLATLAHELRNPMAPLRSALETLRLSQPEDSQSFQLYDMMNRQVDQLVRLVDDLLEVSRLTRGKITLRKEPVIINNIVRSALESTEPLIQTMRHRLHLRLPRGTIWLRGDSLRLSQVLINLLNNAAKYTEPGGDIWLTVEEHHGNDQPEVMISVRDNGRGIDATTLPYIFDSFVQLADGTQSDGGLGIGLSIVRTLVDMHGGRVKAISAGPGQGSEFIVTLPLHAMESDYHQHPQEQFSASAGTTRTLIVDDNVDAARSLADLLTLLGNEVCVVHSGPAALAKLDEFDPGLILLDIDMPGMDGYEVARRLRQRADTRDRQVVALTGFGQEEDRRRAMAAGFDLHLVKPVDLATLQSLYAPEIS